MIYLSICVLHIYVYLPNKHTWLYVHYKHWHQVCTTSVTLPAFKSDSYNIIKQASHAWKCSIFWYFSCDKC